MSLLPWSQSANIIDNERRNGTRQAIHLSSDGYTLLFNGHNGSAGFHSMYRFNFDTNQWQFLHNGSDNANRIGIEGDLNEDGTVYILGSTTKTVNIVHQASISNPVDRSITRNDLDLFGFRVSINGNGDRIAVLGLQNDGTRVVFIYDFNGTEWTIFNSISLTGNAFLEKISSDGLTVMVTSEPDVNNVSSVLIYTLNTTTDVWEAQSIEQTDIDASIPEDHTLESLAASAALSSDGNRVAFTLIHSFLDEGIRRYLAKLIICDRNAATGAFEYVGRIESLGSSAAQVGAVNLSRTGNMVAVGNDNGLNEDGIQTGTVQVFRETSVAGQWEQVGYFAGQELDENIGAATAFADNSRVVAMSSLGSALDEQQGVAFHPVILRVYNLPDAQLVTGPLASGSKVAISTSRIE